MGLFPKRNTLRSPRPSALGRIASHVRSLSAGDAFIVYVLIFVIGILLLSGVYLLERMFLVEIPSRGGELTEGVVGHPRFVNPLLALSDADRDLVTLTFSGLMGYNADGALIPVLAQSYEVTPDGKVYTFHLKKKLTFTDGTPLTAEDIVFTVQKAQDPALKSPRLADWANIRVEAIDAQTVQFTLPKAYAPFLEEATLGILPSHVWRTVSNEEFPFSPYNESPVGEGPYVKSSVTTDKDGIIQKYDLSANGNYALSRANISDFHFVFFDSVEELSQALSRGRVESGYGVPNKNARAVPYSRVFGVFWNSSKNALFARAEVRKALSVALDRPGLVVNVLGGYAEPSYGPVPPQLMNATSTSQEPNDRVAFAKKILTDNGWTYDDASQTWKNKKANLTLAFTVETSNVPELREIIAQVRKDWLAVGVPINVEFHEPSDLVTNVIRPRKYEALLFGMVIGADRDLFAFWDSSERNDPGLNISLYANKSADDLLQKIRTESDPEAVATDLTKLNSLIASDYPAAFTHVPDFLYTLPKDVRGAVFTTIAEPSDRFFSAPYWYRHTEAVWPIFAGK